ncbi:probable inactive receptor-like protein kinase At3g56050 [Prunus avium]|uniref:Probable inactive receptor-like protein kinase At3g56050 n=1 Tax=Prunus avium TaxID=42229 RepID=A0A6P5RRE0_PRUAV|nr:probable inactive receptor-like protein kinase At3g56050 [Prunus avium]XP_021805614.1 probable inactive receptor-like protein kinase At3g56050 [Prunus avium]
MNKKWKFSRLKDRLGMLGMVVVCLLIQNLSFCWSLNDEGLALLRFRDRVVSDPFGALSNWNDDDGEVDPCSWFGVECADGKVVVLNLKDLCLGGTLTPELRNLVHIKSIILRNNSFTGIIPGGIGELKELEVLDLGYNNFSGPLPADLGSNFSLAILLLDNNRLLGILSPEIYNLKILSEFQVDENRLSGADRESSCNERSISWNLAHTEHSIHRRVLQAPTVPPPEATNFFSFAPFIPNKTQRPEGSEPARPPHLNPTFPPTAPASSPSLSAPVPTSLASSESFASKHKVALLTGGTGVAVSLAISILVLYLYKSNKVATVKPWATGLSGQLQKAFVTGVPNLKRSELEAACEDFSNVIGSSPIGTVYKGTLSSGVEIAVASLVETSANCWCSNLELQYRKKIKTLSKVSHKNFVSLIGYCEEEEPFTRMMVFEYAPNGTLFEHLHIKEAEHLDWIMRMRIAMGVAYCLDYMHQLNPPIAHNNLNSSSVQLTEDYAPKVSEYSFWNETAEAEKESPGIKLFNTPSANRESNVYSFGVILFEMVTGRLPYSVDNGSLEDWASDYLRGEQPLKEMVDPTLESFQEEQLDRIGEVIRSCVHPDPKQRPPMREVSARLREITGISPDGATPKLSPLWWAELELLSPDGS